MRYAAFLAFALSSAPLNAHPHVFISTGLKFHMDPSGILTGVEVRWQYDEFYSLLLLEDMALDPDRDGKLTRAELKRLDGFDLNWVKGFQGDLVAHQDGRAVTLGAPRSLGTSMEDGRITTSHYRAISGADAGAVVFKAYDPTYYTAYDLGLGLDLPSGCKAEIAVADLSDAQKALQAELARLSGDAEVDFPEVGAIFADEIVVRCAPH